MTTIFFDLPSSSGHAQSYIIWPKACRLFQRDELFLEEDGWRETLCLPDQSHYSVFSHKSFSYPHPTAAWNVFRWLRTWRCAPMRTTQSTTTRNRCVLVFSMASQYHDTLPDVRSLHLRLITLLAFCPKDFWSMERNWRQRTKARWVNIITEQISCQGSRVASIITDCLYH